MYKAIQFFILLTIFLVPLLGATAKFGYEQSKVFFFIVLTTVAASFWSLSLFRAKKQPYDTTIGKIATVFILVLFVASVFGVDPKNSVFGIQPYFQGVTTYALLLLFSWIVASARVSIKSISYAITGAAGLVALIAIKDFVLLHFLGTAVPTYAGRVVATFGQPNLFAGFLLITLPFAYYLIEKERRRVFGLLSITISVIAIFVSESRIAIFLLLGLLGIFSVMRLRCRVTPLIVGALVVSGIFFAQRVVLQEFIQPDDVQWLSSNAPERRILLWPVMLEIVTKRPLFGYGLENLRVAYQQYFDDSHANRSPSFYSLQGLVVDRAHSYPLDLLIFSGVFGLLVWLLLVAYVYRSLRNGVLRAVLVLYLLWSLVQPQSIAHLIIFWLLVGIAVGEKQNLTEGNKHDRISL